MNVFLFDETRLIGVEELERPVFIWTLDVSFVFPVDENNLKSACCRQTLFLNLLKIPQKCVCIWGSDHTGVAPIVELEQSVILYI